MRYLQPFGSVDGPERTKHSEDSQDLDHGDGAGAADTHTHIKSLTTLLGDCCNDTARVKDISNTDCRKKETRETLTTSRSSRLNQFLQKEPWWRKAPWTVI